MLLKSIANDLGQAAVSGKLSESIGFNVSSMGIIPPPPPSSDPTWNKVNLRLIQTKICLVNTTLSTLHECSLVLCFFVFKPQEATEEVTREEPKVSYVSSVADLLLIVEPIAGVFVGPLYQQPSLMSVDEKVRQRYISEQVVLTAQPLLNLMF